MKSSKHLKTGELGIGFESDTFTTNGIGSCVVLCMWDPILKIGAMAHMFQPSREMIDSARAQSEGASPDTAIPFLLCLMLRLGVDQDNILVRLVGAGNMFDGVKDGSALDVGKGILTSTLIELCNSGLTLKSQSVGGRLGRRVEFTISSGLIQVGLTNGENVIL